MRGLGDLIHFLITGLGLDVIIKLLGIQYCGCDERRWYLNELFPFQNHIWLVLPSSGAISIGQIRQELGGSPTETTSLNSAESGSYGAINTDSPSRPNGANPNAMSEWYSYDHNAAALNYYSAHFYACNQCGGSPVGVLVASEGTLATNRWYEVVGGAGAVQILGTTTSGTPDYTVTNTTLYTNCASVPCVG